MLLLKRMTSNRVVEIENWINDSILVAKRINAVVLLVFALTHAFYQLPSRKTLPTVFLLVIQQLINLI